MPIDLDKPGRWKMDAAESVNMYNKWFLGFAPKTYAENRLIAAEQVKAALDLTENLTNIQADKLRQYPFLLPVLRMATIPPIARDRLIGLAGVMPHLVECMEIKRSIPPKILPAQLEHELDKIGIVIGQLLDKDICVWLKDGHIPTEVEIYKAAIIIGDRLCGASADPIIRNVQEKRQLQVLKQWLSQRGYIFIESGAGLRFGDIVPGTFSFRLNVPVTRESKLKININRRGYYARNSKSRRVSFTS